MLLIDRPFFCSDVLSQPDSQDPTCVSSPTRERARTIADDCLSRLPNLKNGRLDGLRVGVPIVRLLCNPETQHPHPVCSLLTRLLPSDTHQESFPSELSPSSLPPLSRTLSLLKDLGASLHSVSTPLAKHALSAYYIIASAEACSNLARFDGARYGFRAEQTKGSGAAALTAWERTRGEGMGEEVKKRVLVGSYALSAESVHLPLKRLRPAG